MVVALGAFEGGAKPDGTGGVDAVDDLIDAAFFGLSTRFDVGGGAAMKAGGDDLLGRGVRQQVAGDLFEGELIEGHVGIERVHHPIPPGPDFAEVIALKAVGVGVASEVEPRACPADAELIGGEEAVG